MNRLGLDGVGSEQPGDKRHGPLLQAIRTAAQPTAQDGSEISGSGTFIVVSRIKTQLGMEPPAACGSLQVFRAGTGVERLVSAETRWRLGVLSQAAAPRRR